MSIHLTFFLNQNEQRFANKRSFRIGFLGHPHRFNDVGKNRFFPLVPVVHLDRIAGIHPDTFGAKTWCGFHLYLSIWNFRLSFRQCLFLFFSRSFHSRKHSSDCFDFPLLCIVESFFQKGE